MKQLPNRRLGKSDIEVSPIGLGVMQLSGGGKGMMSRAFPAIPEDEIGRNHQDSPGWWDKLV